MGSCPANGIDATVTGVSAEMSDEHAPKPELQMGPNEEGLTRRKLLGVSAGAFVAAILAACGGGTATNTTAPASSAPASSAAASSAAASSAAATSAAASGSARPST